MNVLNSKEKSKEARKQGEVRAVIEHAECPSCGWEGQVLPERGRALCPECEWYFSLPDDPLDRRILGADS